ncbi:hypothetical protein ACHAW6_015673 [Cyclotella cf. meneghiniana]
MLIGVQDAHGHYRIPLVQTHGHNHHPFEELHSTQLSGHRESNIYTKVYNTRETIFTDQKGKFPTCSLADHQYIMIMVEIDSSAILVEPLKNHKDAKLTQSYANLMLCLHRATIQPCKHVLDNEISQAMKDLIQDKYHLMYKLAPPGCHHSNAAEVAICNFTSHFFSILAGVTPDFPCNYGTNYSSKPKSH